MTIKRMLFRATVRTLEWLTMLQPPRHTHLLHQAEDLPNRVDIIVVAFNKLSLLKWQYQLLTRCITDSYHYIVVDNSTDSQAQQDILSFCKQHDITYLGMPKNWLNYIGGSYSHATAVNYTYRHLIRQRQPYAWGIIDHDIFPTRPVSIIEKLATQPFYGPLRLRTSNSLTTNSHSQSTDNKGNSHDASSQPTANEGKTDNTAPGQQWYLSAILSFFRFDFTQHKHIDFMPVIPVKAYFDTGGGNWYSIYRHCNLAQLQFPTESVEPLRIAQTQWGGVSYSYQADRHTESLEWFDDHAWLHTINGSCWKANPSDPLQTQKLMQIEQLLTHFITQLEQQHTK